MAVTKAFTARAKTVKPKKAVAKKPAARKPATKKSVVKKPSAKAPASKPIEEKVVKIRKPRKAKVLVSSYETMLRKQAELDAYKKQAKIELKKQYDEKLKEASELKVHYHKLFSENIDSAPKGRSAGVKKAASRARGYSLEQVQSFLDQKTAGGKIKIAGKNATSIKRMQKAFDQSKDKDAESVLAVLNK
jgi:hypothetical protein